MEKILSKTETFNYVSIELSCSQFPEQFFLISTGFGSQFEAKESLGSDLVSESIENLNRMVNLLKENNLWIKSIIKIITPRIDDPDEVYNQYLLEIHPIDLDVFQEDDSFPEYHSNNLFNILFDGGLGLPFQWFSNSECPFDVTVLGFADISLSILISEVF